MSEIRVEVQDDFAVALDVAVRKIGTQADKDPLFLFARAVIRGLNNQQHTLNESRLPIALNSRGEVVVKEHAAEAEKAYVKSKEIAVTKEEYQKALAEANEATALADAAKAKAAEVEEAAKAFAETAKGAAEDSQEAKDAAEAAALAAEAADKALKAAEIAAEKVLAIPDDPDVDESEE